MMTGHERSHHDSGVAGFLTDYSATSHISTCQVPFLLAVMNFNIADSILIFNVTSIDAVVRHHVRICVRHVGSKVQKFHPVPWPCKES